MRFYHDSSKQWINPFASILLFFLCFGIFFFGVSEVSNNSSEKQTENLNRAIHRGIAHYYAAEGRYPDNLEELKTNYQIVYDTEKYFIDYQISGENIFPDVSIILLEP